MNNDKQSKRWSISDIIVIAGIVGLVGLWFLGLYRAYRFWFVSAGGIWGALAFVGRILAELGLVLAALAATMALFAIVHVGVSIITGTKLRRVKIFISFKHDYESIVTELEKALADRDIEVIRLPFRQRDHDDVIGESFKAVRTADGVVVVPGPESSWLNSELSIAV